MLDVEIRRFGEVANRYHGVNTKQAAGLFNRGYASGDYAAVVFKDGQRLKICECFKLFLTSRVMQYDSFERTNSVREELEALE